MNPVVFTLSRMNVNNFENSVDELQEFCTAVQMYYTACITPGSGRAGYRLPTIKSPSDRFYGHLGYLEVAHRSCNEREGTFTQRADHLSQISISGPITPMHDACRLDRARRVSA